MEAELEEDPAPNVTLHHIEETVARMANTRKVSVCRGQKGLKYRRRSSQEGLRARLLPLKWSRRPSSSAVQVLKILLSQLDPSCSAVQPVWEKQG